MSEGLHTLFDHGERQPVIDVRRLADGREALGYDEALAELDRFVSNPGHDELAALYNVDLSVEPRNRLQALQKLAVAHWDFRKGAERQATDWDIEGELNQEGSVAWRVVFEASDKLGQVESSRPKNKKPDYLVFYGGANKAPDDRLLYGLESVYDFGMLVYLGSSRPISDRERGISENYAPGAKTEFDLGSGAIETRLEAQLVSLDKIERDGDVWAWHEFEFDILLNPGGGALAKYPRTAFSLSTPRRIVGTDGLSRRATTYDNLQFFAHMAELAQNPDKSVVAVTTGFYVPGQHLPAVRELTLPYGVKVETIGHSASYSGVKRKPAQLLMENKAAIDAAVRLQEDLGRAA
jgi:hypothetical protein